MVEGILSRYAKKTASCFNLRYLFTVSVLTAYSDVKSSSIGFSSLASIWIVSVLEKGRRFEFCSFIALIKESIS